MLSEVHRVHGVGVAEYPAGSPLWRTPPRTPRTLSLPLAEGCGTVKGWSLWGPKMIITWAGCRSSHDCLCNHTQSGGLLHPSDCQVCSCQ